jgi:hypothetical protein
VPASQRVHAAQPPPATWAKWVHVAGVVDIAGPRSDGTFLVAAGNVLFLLRPDGALHPFARGQGGYRATTGSEPYPGAGG